MVFKAKVQAGRGQLLNETVFNRVYKVNIDLLENDMYPLCVLILALHGQVSIIHPTLVKLVCKTIG